MDFLYMIIIVAVWALEFVVVKYIYDAYEERKTKEKADGQSRKLPKLLSEGVEGLIAIPLGIGLLALPIWMVSSVTNHAQDQLRDQQWANCANTQNTDGDYLTKQQCEYFRDVMGGKYVDLDTTIQSPREFDN